MDGWRGVRSGLERRAVSRLESHFAPGSLALNRRKAPDFTPF